MSDYGHELRFGVFLTPLADQADDLIAPRTPPASSS
jgi:hypothetical protein